MTGKELVQQFLMGATSGHAGHLGIVGDSLYSYERCIARRMWSPYPEQGHRLFIISNRAKKFGGQPFSQSTSRHICLAAEVLLPNRIVVGWVDGEYLGLVAGEDVERGNLVNTDGKKVTNTNLLSKHT